MTLDDIRAMSKPTILASEAAQVLGCTPQWLRLMAREQPESWASRFAAQASTE